MYRHDTHTQALTPLDARVGARGGAGVDRLLGPRRRRRAIRAFVRASRARRRAAPRHVALGPVPDPRRTSVRLLNVQGRRYAEDNASVDLTARTGRVVEVVSP